MDRIDTHPSDLLPEYALGVLDEAGMEFVSAHLTTCDTCREETRGYQGVSDQLGLAAKDAAPPEGLREKILSRVPESGSGVQAKVRRGGWLGRLAGLSRAWAAVGGLAIVLLATSNLLLWQQVQQSRQENVPMQVVVLNSTDAAPGANGLLVVSGDGESGTLVVDDLPALDEALAYQLWLIRDGERTSGGLFTVGENGYGALRLWPEEPLSNYEAFGITIEPAGGSPGPTGAQVLAGEF